jgi:hypothetical protein
LTPAQLHDKCKGTAENSTAGLHDENNNGNHEERNNCYIRKHQIEAVKDLKNL